MTSSQGRGKSLPSLLRSRYLGRHATLLKRCVTTQITAAEETRACPSFMWILAIRVSCAPLRSIYYFFFVFILVPINVSLLSPGSDMMATLLLPLTLINRFIDKLTAYTGLSRAFLVLFRKQLSNNIFRKPGEKHQQLTHAAWQKLVADARHSRLNFR